MLDDLKAGKDIPARSQTGRQSSMAEGEATTLTEIPERPPADPTADRPAGVGGTA